MQAQKEPFSAVHRSRVEKFGDRRPFKRVVSIYVRISALSESRKKEDPLRSVNNNSYGTSLHMGSVQASILGSFARDCISGEAVAEHSQRQEHAREFFL